MSKHSDRAVELFMQGFNCSQSVFAAFCDEIGMDEETALRVSAGLGAGVGRMREVCGTVSAAAMITGMVYGSTDGEDREKKAKTYEMVQKIAQEFRKENPSIVCREILGIEKGKKEPVMPDIRTPEYYKKRPCPKIIENTAKIIDRVIFETEE